MQAYSITGEGKTYVRPDSEGEWYKKSEVQDKIAAVAQTVVRKILADMNIELVEVDADEMGTQRNQGHAATEQAHA